MSQSPHIQEIKIHCNGSRGEGAPQTGDPLHTVLSAAPGTGMGNMNAAQGGRLSRGLSASSYWITPAISNVTMAVTSIEPAHLTMSLNFVNNTGSQYAHGALHIIDFPRLIRLVRILGMMAVISYMSVILFTWIYANMQGYVYFSAGEPVLMIKYPEWVLGFIGIFAAADLLRKELDDEASYKKVL